MLPSEPACGCSRTPPATRRRTSCPSSSRPGSSAAPSTTSCRATSTASCACSRPASSIPTSRRRASPRRCSCRSPANFHKPQGKQPKGPKVRHNQWRYADYDGDGALDLIVGVEDWSYYGWDDAWNATGEWHERPAARLRLSSSQQRHDRRSPTTPSRSASKPTASRSTPSAARRRTSRTSTATATSICSAASSSTASPTSRTPARAPSRSTPRAGALKDADGAAAGDGPGDDRAGRVRLGPGRRPRPDRRRRRWPRRVRREHRQARRRPHARLRAAASTSSRRPTRSSAARWPRRSASTGTATATPTSSSGNTAGYIEFFENLSGPKVAEPKWAAPKRLEVGRQDRSASWPARTAASRARPKRSGATPRSASPTGTATACPTSCSTRIWGDVRVAARTSAPAQQPKLAAPQPIEVEWDGAAAEARLGLAEAEGQGTASRSGARRRSSTTSTATACPISRCSTRRATSPSSSAPRRDGKLVLLPPRRAFVDENGEPLRLNAEAAGRSGRRKLCVTDWDGDGKFDFLLNSANADLLQQVGDEERQRGSSRTPARWRAEHRGPRRQPRRRRTSTATACPTSSAARRRPVLFPAESAVKITPEIAKRLGPCLRFAAQAKVVPGAGAPVWSILRSGKTPSAKLSSTRNALLSMLAYLVIREGTKWTDVSASYRGGP